MAVKYFETSGRPMLRLENETGVHVPPPTGTALEAEGWERTSAGDGRRYWFPPEPEKRADVLAAQIDTVIIRSFPALAQTIVDLSSGDAGECFAWFLNGEIDEDRVEVEDLVRGWQKIGCTYGGGER